MSGWSRKDFRSVAPAAADAEAAEGDAVAGRHGAASTEGRRWDDGGNCRQAAGLDRGFQDMPPGNACLRLMHACLLCYFRSDYDRSA